MPAPIYFTFRDDPAQEAQNQAGSYTGKMKTGDDRNALACQGPEQAPR